MLVIRHDDLIGTYDQKRAPVSQFNLMDDTFFSVVMRDKAACEYLLSALMGKNVSVIEHKTQYSIRNIESRSVVLDALVEDSEHNLYNVEVQKDNKRNHERRMRYNQTAIDWTYLEKGVKYDKLPELYMIFILILSISLDTIYAKDFQEVWLISHKYPRSVSGVGICAGAHVAVFNA